MVAQRSLVLVMLLLQLLLDPVLGLDRSLAQGRRRLSTEGANEPQMVSITGDPNEGELKYDTVAGTVGAMEGGTQEGNIARHLQSDDEQEDGAVDETDKNVEPAEAGDQSLSGESTAGAGDENDSEDGAIGDDQGAIGEPPETPPNESTDENDSGLDDQGAIGEPPETPPNESVAGAGEPPEKFPNESVAAAGGVNDSEDGAIGDDGGAIVEQESVSKDEEDSEDSEKSIDSEEEEEKTTESSTEGSPSAELTLEDLSFDAISLTSCQKINFAVAYLTSLEFDGSLVANAKKSEEFSAFWSDVYYLQMVVMPVSLMLAFFGSHLLFPASVMTAAAFGTFLVFHFVNGYFGGGLNCKLKLGLSAVSAGFSVAMAIKFVRFGLFTLGAVATGIGSYMFFDAFPFFDPGNSALASANDTAGDASYLASVMNSSDISPLAWGITLLLALFTGICIKVYQQASVEVLTAVMGGVGIGYSMHSFILLHGGTLDRSIAFILAGFISVYGT
jgi:hypothetical protein